MDVQTLLAAIEHGGLALFMALLWYWQKTKTDALQQRIEDDFFKRHEMLQEKVNELIRASTIPDERKITLINSVKK